MNSNLKKVAIVTGASSGIGAAAANLLAARGYTVFGTSRRGGNSNKFEMLSLDVTDDSSVKALVKEVLQRAGRIDLLVNNAGFGVLGGAEESSMAQAHALFETNVFGLIRMIQAVLPEMRSQGSGRIINISSILGKIPAPYAALYAATKHAVEGYSESLDHEIRNMGIRSLLVEPGPTKTSFEQNATLSDLPMPIYEKGRSQIVEFLRDPPGADTPDVVAATIVQAATDAKPRLRYTAGAMATKTALLRRFVPASLFDSSLRKSYRLDG